MHVIFGACVCVRGPSFCQPKCHSCCWRNYGCVWSITKRKCHGSSQIYCTHAFVYAWSVHVCIYHTNGGQEKAVQPHRLTKTLRLVEKRNALATCCAIEFVFCTCGWCVNSLRLQIQVILNTSSLPNWNLFRNECMAGECFFLTLVQCLQKLKWLLISCTYLFPFWQRKTCDEMNEWTGFSFG